MYRLIYKCFQVNKKSLYIGYINHLKLSTSSSTSSLSNAVINHLHKITSKYNELGEKLSSNVLSPDQIAIIGKEYSNLAKLTNLAKDRTNLIEQIAELDILEQDALKTVDGKELIELARQEKITLEDRLIEIQNEIILELTPKDDVDDRGAVIEVRSGTGGDEASLFASEIFRMYQRYAGLMGWRWEELSFNKSEIGGFKEAQASVKGESVFKKLKFESGVHRVQRIPINDTKIQTSAASVVILPEAEELDVEIKPADLRIDVFRANGAGGQNVQKTESAVRLTHIPTGIVVSMQDERSQKQNRAKAMQYLRARVYDFERRRKLQSRNELRTAAQGTGDRSDKIRTYNFPQDRVSDHRISYTITGIERVMMGEDLSRIVDALIESDEKEKLSNFIQSLETNHNNN